MLGRAGRRGPDGRLPQPEPASRSAGPGPYAIFWTLVIGARAAFSYGAAHWFSAPLVGWAIANQVSEAAITDGLIFMAVAMVLVRTAGLGFRASRLPARASPPRPPPPRTVPSTAAHRGHPPPPAGSSRRAVA